MKPLLADSPPSLLKFTAQQISLLALHTFPSHGPVAFDWDLAAYDLSLYEQVASGDGDSGNGDGGGR